MTGNLEHSVRDRLKNVARSGERPRRWVEPWR